VRRVVVAIALSLLVLGAAPGGATADGTPANPQQQLALIQQIRAQLGSNLADALAAQQQLRLSLQTNSAQQQQVQGKISDIEAKIGALDDQIAQRSCERRSSRAASKPSAPRSASSREASTSHQDPSCSCSPSRRV